MAASPSQPLSLRAWLFLGSAVLSTLPLLALSIGFAELGWRAQRGTTSARFAGGATAVALSIDADLDQLQKSLQSLASVVAEQGLGDGASLERQLARHHAHYPDFLTMIVTDREGLILASDPALGTGGLPLAGLSVADRDYFRQPLATGEPFVSDVFQGRGFGSDFIIAASVPWRRGEGEIAGVVEGSLHLERYGRFLEPHLALEGTELLILDRAGRVVAASSNSPFKPMDPVPVELLEAGAAEVAVWRLPDQRYLVASARAGIPGWTVVVRRPLALVEGERRLTYLATAGWIVLALALSLLLAWAASERAARPLLASEQRYRELVDQSFGFICTHDLEGRVLSANPAGAESFGAAPEAVVGKNLRDLLRPEVARDFDSYLRRIRDEGSATGLMQVLTAAGEERIWMYRNRLVEREGAPPQVVANAIDVTERREREKKLADLALRDPLTGAANRALFEDRLRQAIERARRYGHRVALVYLDVDHLKKLNDTHGHAAGDALLRQLTARTESRVRRLDTVARLGGDEFAVVLPEVGKAENVARLVQGIEEVLSEPFEIEGATLTSSVSVGVALFPEDAASAEELLAAADRAMYLAKRTARNGDPLPGAGAPA